MNSMPEDAKTLIMKFGGAAVKDTESFSRIADLIIKRNQEFSRIVIVVSAMGKMTDELITLAKKVHPNPPRREYDMLVSTGERISISLLAMALALKERHAVSFTGSQSGIITTSSHAEAKIIDVIPSRLLPPLEEGKLVIVAGFQGVSRHKEITTLGRGGSDTTAVALGVALGATKIEFYKDVQGIYAQDPKTCADAYFHSALTHEEALKVVEGSGGKVLHPRAIALAQANNLNLEVRSFESEGERCTLIYPATNVKNLPIYES
jgi:aspartate kinase